MHTLQGSKISYLIERLKWQQRCSEHASKSWTALAAYTGRCCSSTATSIIMRQSQAGKIVKLSQVTNSWYVLEPHSHSKLFLKNVLICLLFQYIFTYNIIFNESLSIDFPNSFYYLCSNIFSLKGFWCTL